MSRIKLVLMVVAFAGLALTFGALSAHLKSMRVERDHYMVQAATSNEQLKFASEANAGLVNQIKELKAERQEDLEARERLQKLLTNLDKNFELQGKKLDELKRQNPTVRNYLDAPIPDELRNLATEGTGIGGATGKSRVQIAPGKPDAKAPGSQGKAVTNNR